ncbi:MAG: alpha/beta hydrolase [Pyrinomonadaceae bacterium]|nr:alpha/beta hydrolase [Pyrinomonadaceae bacterium]
MKKRYLLAGVYGLAGATLAAKLLSRPRDVEWEEHHAGVAHAERSKFAEVGGARVHYQETGSEDAPTIILIHGFCASTFVWSDVIAPVAEMGFRVIVPDLIGYGFSEKPRAARYTIDAQARMIVGLMGELKIERAALVGSSYGGAVAATVALDHPQRVERLVLVGAVTDDKVKNSSLMRLAVSPVMGDLLSPVLLGSFPLMRRHMRKIYAEGNAHLLDERRLAAHHLPMRAATTHRAIIKTLRGWQAERIGRDAHLIEHPTLLVWGEHDTVVPLARGRELNRKLPHSRLVILGRCGHLPQEERPAEFAGLVAGFCKTTKPKVMTVAQGASAR